MANPARGSVALQAGDTAYTVSFSVNALCELEAAFGGMTVQNIGALFDDPANVSMTNIRKLVMCGLQDHHDDVDEKQAGKIATEAGLQTCMDAISKAFQLAFPEAAKAGANPQKAKASGR
ncbi:GTA-gp10 family protein [Pseudorhizobium sp. NPDC055634]